MGRGSGLHHSQSNPTNQETQGRGDRHRILDAGERQKILDAIPDEGFQNFVHAMQETGCRPCEVSKVTAEQVNLEVGIWVFEEHKTAHKTGESRVVYLSPAMLELTRRLVEKYPKGPLFRGKQGQGYNTNSIQCRFKRLREKLPEFKHFCAYAYLHTYTTEALMNGVGIAQVAELLTKNAFPIVSSWYLMPKEAALVGDRYFWNHIRASKLTRAHRARPTVNYRTPYRTHYKHFGLEPPEGAKETIVVFAGSK